MYVALTRATKHLKIIVQNGTWPAFDRKGNMEPQEGFAGCYYDLFNYVHNYHSRHLHLFGVSKMNMIDRKGMITFEMELQDGGSVTLRPNGNVEVVVETEWAKNLS